MADDTEALKSAISPRAFDELEVFTRHGGWNEEDLQAWRNFTVYTFLDGKRAERNLLRAYLRTERSDDTEEQTEDLLDEYEEALALIKTFTRLAQWEPTGN